jgi:hypothetical protein
MYFHIVAALVCWLVGIFVPSLSEKYMLTLMLMGFIALLLFLKDLLANVNKQFLLQAEEAEKESTGNLSFFQGKFVMIRDEDSPFSDEFSYIIFNDGKIDIPLFCRNLRIIQKATMANNELIVYYKDHILVNIEEIE